MTGQAIVAGDAKVYPLTYEQEAMWVDDHLDDRPSRYLESWVHRLSGPLDLAAMDWALARVVDRHEALRSRLVDDAAQLVQVMPDEHGTRLERARCAADAVDDELDRMVRRPLDLTESALRAVVWQVAADDFVLAVQFHHSVIDDWALAVLSVELGELYAARVAKRAPRLEPLPLRFGAFAETQRAAAIDPVDLAYWRQRLWDIPANNSVPADRPRPGLPGPFGGQVSFRIDRGVADLVRRTARAERTTAFTVLAAGLAALICGYLRTSDVVLGTPVSLRGDSNLDSMIACLTRLMPLRLTIDPGESFGGLVRATAATVWEAVAHKGLPYAVLAARAAPRKQIRAAPLCQTVLVVDDEPATPLRLPGVRAERIYVHPGTSKFDLCVTLVTDNGGYRGFLEYSTDLYDPKSAERIARDFPAVLGAVLNDTLSPLSELLSWMPHNATYC